jgi:hypothetical protein
LALAFLNYEPGTFLIGWDNLNPEFDAFTNLKRAFFSVWQEGRGLGLLGGQAHAADIPRILLILLLQVFKTPLSLIRYLTTFLPLLAGPLGVYYLFYHHLFREKLDAKTTQFASFLGALFYLLNLNTLQTFFVPFETFTWFYGTLPWLLFFTISYIGKPSARKLFTLFLMSLITAPAFYVETVFLVFFVSILPFIIEYFTEKRRLTVSFKTVTAGILSIVIPHLYWLIPVAFFVITGGGQTAQIAKINQISTPQTYYRNLEFANLNDIFLLKGYLFNYLDMGGDFKYDYLLSTWRSHLSTPLIALLGYFSVSLILIGVYYSFKKKFSWTASFMCVLGLSLFFLLGGGRLINQVVPVLGELFRSPFTKFSIPLSLSFSFFFAIGTIFILDLFTFLHSRLTYLLTLFTISVILILYMSPAFSGNLISGNMRLVVPSEYFSLFNYLKSQNPSHRVANFPQYTFWGWNYYDWGYRGSGFLWHGIRQPLLDRAFDVWDSSSEKYYEEISSAIYRNDLTEFEKLIDKYAITWILLDKHVISPDGKTDLGYTTLEKFLTSSTKFSLNKSFNDQIFLYQTNLSKPTQNFLSLSRPATNNSKPITPFSSLSLRPNPDWIEKAGHLSISVQTHQNTNTGSSVLSIPSFTSTEKLIPIKIEYQKTNGLLTLRLTPVTPIIFAGGEQINLEPTTSHISIPVQNDPGYIVQLDQQFFTLRIPAELPDVIGYFNLATAYLPTDQRFSVSLYSLYQSAYYPLTNTLSQATPVQCYTDKPNRKIEKILSPNGISLLGTDVNGCLSAQLPSTSPDNLISYSFIYSSPNLLTGNVNISGIDFNSPEVSAPLEPSNTPKEATLFTHSTGDYQQLNLILAAEGSKSIQEIVYQDINVAIHSRIYSSSIALPKIPSETITLDSPVERIQVSLPLTATQFDLSQIPESNSLFPESRNCDQFNQGKVVKLVSEAGFFYQSQNAIECDNLNLRHFSHSLNYLISFGARTEKGLSLTTCLENYATRRCDVYERLIDSNITQSIIQPVANPEEAPGYTLHLFNESIGNRISSNLLKSIIIHPIPLNFLKNISLSGSSPTTYPSLREDPSMASAPTISSTHPAEFLYSLSVTDENLSQINLYQTKSPYWKAFKMSSDDLKLPSWLLTAKIFFRLPYLTQLDHNDTGLWYNSWILPADTATSLAIIYLPQYLEFIGLAAIPVSLLLLFIFRRFFGPKK